MLWRVYILKFEGEETAMSLEAITKVVRTGEFIDDFNGVKTKCGVQIIESNVRFGNGEEYSTNSRDYYQTIDMPILCFYIEFLSPTSNGGVFVARTEEHFSTVTETRKKAERMIKQKINWTKVL